MVCPYCKKDLAACEGVFMHDKEGDCINAYQIHSSKEARNTFVFKQSVTRVIVNTISEHNTDVM